MKRKMGQIAGRPSRRHDPRSHSAVAEGIGVVVCGLLGLLAFILGLGISMAEGPYQERRQLGMHEANAIGTAWLRAQMVGGPEGLAIAQELEAYTRNRIAWITSAREAPDLGTLMAAGAARCAFGIADQCVERDLRPRHQPALRLCEPHTGRNPLAAAGLTVLSMAAIGYQGDVRDNPQPAVTLVLLAAWTACIMLIVGLGTARMGFVRGDPMPYEWTLRGFSGGLQLPPGAAPR